MKKIIKETFLILLFALSFMSSYGQETPKDKNYKNTIFIEVLGNGFYSSVNYERQLTKEMGLTFRAGIGFYYVFDLGLTLPVSVQYLINVNNNNYIETGIGYTWAEGASKNIFGEELKEKQNSHALFMSVGYRKHFGKNWMWKANFTPLIGNRNSILIPWVGLSIGRRF